jgi:hypothetical protein
MMTLATSSSGVDPKSREVIIQYAMPSMPQVKICLRQRNNADVELNDFTVSQQHNVDSTGLVCMWPAEEILTYFCVLHPDVFRYVTKLKLQLWYFLSKHAIMIGWVRFWLSSAAPNINNFVKWTMVTKKVSCEDPEKKKI